MKTIYVKKRHALPLSFIIAILLFISNITVAQNIGREVISTQGGQTEKDGLKLSWTIGQSGLAGSSTAGDITLHAGFEQENDGLFVSVSNLDNDHFKISVFPNPFSEELNFSVKTSKLDALKYCLFDMNGRIIQSDKAIPLNSQTNRERISFQSLLAGSYVLHLKLMADGKIISNKSIKIIKTK